MQPELMGSSTVLKPSCSLGISRYAQAPRRSAAPISAGDILEDSKRRADERSVIRQCRIRGSAECGALFCPASFVIPAVSVPFLRTGNAVRPELALGVRISCRSHLSFTPAGTPCGQKFSGERLMLELALFFLVVAVIAAVFGFTGIAAAAAGIAKIIFYIFVALFVIFLIIALMFGAAIF
jgi:uncharacterized membrane protein YtjA (UPF0391 family)